MTDDEPLPVVDPEFEAWFTSREVQFPIAAVIMAAQLWHVQHRERLAVGDCGPERSEEAALHAAVELFNHALEKFHAGRVEDEPT